MKLTEQDTRGLTGCGLFTGLSAAAVSEALSGGGRVTEYGAGGALVAQGECVREVGVVLSGGAEAAALSAGGRRVVLARLRAGGVFGDVLCAVKRPSPVAVTATEPTRAVLLPFEALAQNPMVSRNMLVVFADKYFNLHDRVNCLTEPTLRGKILRYLSNEGGAGAFNVPLSRAAMADYLNADRSALSRELAAMKRDGLIDYYKNSFRVI